MIQLATHSSVQPARDEWVRPGDERPVAATSGGSWGTDRADGRPSVLAVYGIVICLVAAASVANVVSGARDISRRLGTPHDLWEPMLWNLTGGVVVVALLPIVHGAATLLKGRCHTPRRGRGRLRRAPGFISSALHIAGMGPLRELTYGLGGWNLAPFGTARAPDPAHQPEMHRSAGMEAFRRLQDPPRRRRDRARQSHSRAGLGYFGLVLSGAAGRAPPQGSYFSLGSGMRSSAAL